MKEIKIVHLSDIHIDKPIGINSQTTYSLHAMSRIENMLKTLEFDCLVVSGDLTMDGNRENCINTLGWLKSKIHISETKSFGLDLEKRNIPFIVVPGNHDLYNSSSNKSYFNETFDKNQKKIISIEKKGVKINFHLYDSCKKKSLYKGYIEKEDRISKQFNKNELNICVLHHYIIQPPQTRRERSYELEDIRNTTSYLLSSNFNAILFGHLHKSFTELISNKLIIKMIPENRGKKRALRKLKESILLDKLGFSLNNHPLAYKRTSTKSNEFPSFERYFQYLYIKEQKGNTLKNISDYKNLKSLLEDLDRIISYKDFNFEINNLLSQKVLVSMVPTCCYSKRLNGCSLINFILDDKNILKKIDVTNYSAINGNNFESKKLKFQIT
jgi:3',5'-cyclic AMP phosphodiesterase CpdA